MTPTDTPPAGRRRDELASPPLGRALPILTAVAVVIGVALRFVPRSGLWLDEALTVNISTLPLADIPDALRRDGHPPLFYVLLHFWAALGGTSDWWVRALAGVISVASLPLAYLAGRRVAERTGAGPLGVRRTGLLALAVMAILPYGIRYGAETRMYSLAILLSTAGYLLVDDLLTARSSGRRRALVTVGAAAVTAGLLWTHYWSMWLLAPVGLLALWWAWRGRSPEERTGGRLLVGALAVGGIAFLPWVPTLLFQSENTGTPWGEVFGPVEVVTTTIQEFSGEDLSSYLAVAFILLAAFATISLARSRRSQDPGELRAAVVLSDRVEPRVRLELALIVGTLGIGWAASAAAAGTYSSRYAAVIYPLYVLAIATGLALLRHRRALVGALALLMLMSTYTAVGTTRTDRTQADEIGERIAQEVAADPGPVAVIACPDQIGVALQRSLDHLDVDVDVLAYPAGGNPRFIDWVDYGARNESSDDEEFLAEQADRIPADATVYVVATPSYRTFEGKCENLVNLVATGRPLTGRIDGDESGEPMGLSIFGPSE